MYKTFLIPLDSYNQCNITHCGNYQFKGDSNGSF